MPDDQHFDAIEIRPAERQVLVDGNPAALGARAFDLLMALYERRERVVGKNELLDLVWPGLVVEENNLQVQVSSLRKVLGPSAIATIPGRGYRFTLPLGAPARVARASEASTGEGGPVPIEDALRTNLPAAAPLFGRDDDLGEAAELMRRCPVVSIVGAGGIGKTRLALALAAADPLDAPEGRWWIELGPLTDGDQIPVAIAGVLGVQLPTNRPPLGFLAGVLARQRLLVVLDNCEHLAEPVAALVALLRAQAPGVRLLITSQESLKCVDEQVYRLGSLEVPTVADPEQASRAGAVALFVARARAVEPRFRLAEDNVEAVIDICRRLDGIPLAIELAAARVPPLGVTGLQSRLNQMFNVLTGVARMKLRRHQTLRAALEWSVGLLSEDERTVFRRLGVFAGGFTLELAQAVARDDAIDEWLVLDILVQLIDKSLVIAEGEDEPRYRLLEPTRAFALEQLAAAGESEAVLRRHAEAVCDAVATFDDLQWTEPYEQRRRRWAEIGNLRAAVNWAMSPAGDRELAIRMLGTGWFLWIGNSTTAEGFDRMMALWPLPAGLPPKVEAAFCLALASLKTQAWRDEVLQAAQRAVELHRELGDRQRLTHSLVRCAATGMAREADWVDAAIAEAAELIDDSAPTRLRALVAMIHGSRALGLHHFDAARVAFGRQAELYRQEGEAAGEYAALINLGMVSLDAGEIDEAVATLRRAMEGLRREKAQFNLSSASTLYAVALAVQGDHADVLPLARQGYDHASQMGGGYHAFKPLMAAALHLGQRGDGHRAALIAGHCWATLTKATSNYCIVDVQMKEKLVAMGRERGWTVDAWMADGARLTQAQAAELAFEDRRVEESPG
jgi:predicted ATPase/DNA-binding winged helix-turn-helix (wHTH) protein